MKKMKYGLLLWFALMCALVGVNAQTGTATDPYPIKTKAQLVSLAQRINAGGVFYFNPADSTYATSGDDSYKINNMAEGSCFKLVADIVINHGDMGTYNGLLGDGQMRWTPIGTDAHPFDGTLDGDFHVISGVIVDQTEAGAGFFGSTANHATIKNLGVVNSYIKGDNATGGLVGNALSGTFTKCFFSGMVESTGSYAGGLIGQMQSGTAISSCYANAQINATGSQVGGLVGRIDSPSPACSISNSYSSSIVNGLYQFTGGVVGEDLNGSTTYSSACYDQQMINLTNYAPNTIGTGYATTAMTSGSWTPGSDFANNGTGHYPYLNGFDISNLSIYFSTIPIFLPDGTSLSDMSTVNDITLGGTGVTWSTNEVVGLASLSGNTITVTGQSYISLKATKGDVSRSYTILINKEPLLGTAENPFTIDNIDDLTAFRDGINTGVNFTYKHFTVPALGENTVFKQTANITMPSTKWESIGNASTTPFKGVYDGDNHAVIGWTAQEQYKSAFFRYINGATLKNLTVKEVKSPVYANLVYVMYGGIVDNCHAEGSTRPGGGLILQTSVSEMGAIIRNCSNKNTISTPGGNANDAPSYTGGIVTYVYDNNNLIENCHNYGDITNNKTAAGGIVGAFTESNTVKLTINNCSNSGTISNYSGNNGACAGGIVASAYSYSTLTLTITHCHNSGNINSYYSAAGISYVNQTRASYCYNTGNVTSGSSTTTSSGRSASAVGISRASGTANCFNTGRITNYNGPAYGISSNKSTNCINAGEVVSLNNNSVSLIKESTGYTISRLGGDPTYVGGTYFDGARTPSYTFINDATQKTTAEMTSGSLFGNANWVETAGLYPRIKGLDSLDISKAIALPIWFGNSTDHVDSVTTDFEISKGFGIKWVLEDATGATIVDISDSRQKVTLPADRTKGNIILAATKDSVVLYRITLKMGVAYPGSLTVDNVNELIALRNGINSGIAFNYKGTPVPASGKGTTFLLTADFDMPTTNWQPIGTAQNPFLGTFDGNNHTLSKMIVSNYTNGGLFGYVQKGTIKNLTLKEVDLTECTYAGAICGQIVEGRIDNCRAYGEIQYPKTPASTFSTIGGIVGSVRINSTISHCENYANISSPSLTASTTYWAAALGGIVGHAEATCYIDTCINGGNLTAVASSMAGICANGGQIRGCINYGDITSYYTVAVAGIATYATSYTSPDNITQTVPSVSGCVNSGNVISKATGAASARAAGVSYNGNVTNSCNLGLVDGGMCSTSAGIMATGSSSYSVTNCYNAGQVTGKGTYICAVTLNDPVATNCFNDSQMCTATYGKGTHKVTTEMCGNSLQASLGDGFVYESGMYPCVKGIDNLKASKAIAAPIFLVAGDSVTLVEEDFTTGGCANHHIVWTVDREASVTIDNANCSNTIGAPGIAEMRSTLNDTIYKKVLLNIKFSNFVIKDKAQLVEFRARINSGATFYYNAADSTYHATDDAAFMQVAPRGEGETFLVVNDIDMGGETITPIGNNTEAEAFKGTFDGGNHTISNYVLKDRTYSGLFGYVSGGTIRNLTLDKVVLNSTANAKNAYIGVLAGYIASSSVSNITIKNSHLETKYHYVGGLAGGVRGLRADHITLLNDTISGTDYVAGGVAYYGGHRISNFLAKKCVIEGARYVGTMSGDIQQASESFYMSTATVDTCTVKGTSYVGGLFGRVTYNHSSIATDIRINGGSVTATGNYAGGIAGSAGGLTISASTCVNSADIKGNNYVGGFFGYKSYHATSNLYNFGTVEGNDYVGGIIGSTDGQSGNGVIAITQCVNNGKVIGHDYVGGIRGYAPRNTTQAAQYCINFGEVEGNQYVGGILGDCQGNIRYNTNAGRIKGANYVGGIVGRESTSNGVAAMVEHNISVGQVDGTENVGNIAGIFEEGTLRKCWYDKQMSPDYGGIGTTGRDSAGVAEGKLTREMTGSQLSGLSGFVKTDNLYPCPTDMANTNSGKVASTPIVLNDDITAYTIPGILEYTVTPTTLDGVTWRISQGNALRLDGTSFKVQTAGRTLLSATAAGFSKTLLFRVGVSKDLPCVIKNDAQLAIFTNGINSGDIFYYNTADSTYTLTDPGVTTAFAVEPGGEGFFFKLNYDPSFQFTEWAGRIGTSASPFLGDFNGDNHTISYLPTANSDTCGFFGYNAGTVYDLTLANSNMAANEYGHVGAVAGFNSGTITNCHAVNGQVQGKNNVGAIAGTNNGFISGCHNSAKVSGTNYVGGITGGNRGSLRLSFNMGDITASAQNAYLGGVSGNSSNTLSDCYNVGNITATSENAQNVGGVVGRNAGSIFANCYNAGQVTTADETAAGGVAGSSSSVLIASLAFDNQMCTQTNVFGSGEDGLSTVNNTASMIGSSLESVLGTENWIYTDGMYPRLAIMEDLNASILSASPIVLTDGENVKTVAHEFTAFTAENSVTWTASSDAVVLTNIPDVEIDHCGTPVMTASRGDEKKNIQLEISHTGSLVESDTTCGEPYTWEVNGITYYTSNTVVVSQTIDGCPFTKTLKITIPEPLTLTVDSTAETCFEAEDGSATAHVTGGFGNYFYEWVDEGNNVVGTSATISNLAPGKYFLTVKDTVNPKECTLEETVTIDAATELVLKIDTSSAGCYGVTDGFFRASFSGGKAPYVLAWSSDAVNDSRNLTDPQVEYPISSLNDGTYTVTVTDANNCTATATVVLGEEATPYVVSAYSEEKKYDGITVHANRYSLKIGTAEPDTFYSNTSVTLANGDKLTAIVEADECTNAGVYSNDVMSCVITRNGEDVTCQYNLTTEDGNVVIQKREVTITSLDSTDYFDSSNPDFILTRPVVKVTGDGFATGEEVTYNFTGQQQGGGTSDNTFEIVWGSVNPDNYIVSSNFGKLTLIENGVLVVRAIGLNRTYDGTTNTYPASTANGAEGISYEVTAYYVKGPGDTIYGLGPEYRVEVEMNNGMDIVMKDADTIISKATSIHAYKGTTDVTMSFIKRDTIPATLQINPREITLTSDGNTWTYDGNEHTLPNVTVEGTFVDGEVTDVTATGNITNVGTEDNTIELNTTANYKEQNYKITKEEGILEVTKRTLTLTGITTYVDYNGLEQQTTDFTYDNLLNGHTASGVNYKAAGTEVGGYDGAFSGTLVVMNGSENVTANYEVEEVLGKLWIRSLVAELNIVSADKTQMYDGTAVTAQTYTVNFSQAPVNSVDDNFHFRLSTGDTLVITPTLDGVTGLTHVGSVKNAFTYAIVPTAHASNYTNITLDSGMITVTPRTVTLKSMPLTQVYNAQPIRYDSVQVAGSLFAAGESATYTFSNPGTWTEVGEYKNAFTYTLQNAVATDYTLTLDTGILKITPAELLVAANDRTRNYGELDTFSYSITGFQGTDDESVISGLEAITYTCAANQYSPVGTYTITPDVTGLTAANYTFKPVDGTLTIRNRKLVVHANSVTVPYDGTEHNATTDPTTISKYVGLAAGDVADATMKYNRIPAGITKMTLNNIVITHNGDDVTSNYTITVSDTSKLNITKKKLKLIVTDKEKLYDSTPLVADEYIVDAVDTLAEGDVISNVVFTGSQTEVGTSQSDIDVSALRIMHGTLDVLNMYPSYELTIVKGNLTITGMPGPITLTSASEEVAYDGTLHKKEVYTVTYDGTPLTADATGLVFTMPITGDKLTITPTFAGVTNVADANNVDKNNTFTYVLENNDTYLGTRDTTIGTVKVIPNGNVTVTIVGHTAGFDCDGEDHTVHGYDVTITDSLNIYAMSDFSFSPAADSIVTESAVGTYEMDLQGKFTNNNTNYNPVTFNITNGSLVIVDTIKPTFTKPNDITIYTDASCNYVATVAVTGDVTDEADNCSADLNATFVDEVADGDCQGMKVITRTWSLVDEYNNKAADQIQIITVKDTIKPTFTAPDNITIYSKSDCSYDATVDKTGDVTDEADNCSTNLVATFVDVVEDGDCEGMKVITRTWSLEDNCGNKAADQIQTITVKDT
ncbi:MAG: hypothetical protein IKR71_02455, partial [Bacteroidales bacterium]|nr:hypothetical protein [Bacteroidales bacterium]